VDDGLLNAMSSLLKTTLILSASLGSFAYSQTDILAYAGGKGNVRFTSVHALTEGAVLVAGGGG
jgi:hypothetical protein